MKTVNIIIQDFLVNEQIALFISDTLKLKCIDLHLLLPQIVINDSELLKKLNLGLGIDASIVENIISQQIKENLNEDLLIPLDLLIFKYPKDLSVWKSLLVLLTRHNLNLNRIWHIKNSNIYRTVEESMIMHGYEKPFDEKNYSIAVSRTIDHQKATFDFIQKINCPELVLTLETDTMNDIPTNIISIVNNILQSSKT